MKYQIISTVGQEDLLELENLNTLYIDVLEVRLDLCSPSFVRDKLLNILLKWNKSILFTHRRKEDSSEKIHHELDLPEFLPILEKFNSSSNYIDIDMKARESFFSSIQHNQYSIIYSYHNFGGSIGVDEMKSYIKDFYNTYPQNLKIFKFAILPRSEAETVDFLKSGIELSKSNQLILIIMGDQGVFTRIFGDKFGSRFTYSCITTPKAPGQIQAEYIRNVRKLSGIE
jgi:3-dehydroquinate dehydratase I